jgi:dTDP-4-dehydrorhamnose reductase
VIDRSLDSSLFRALTGYVPPSWPDLVRTMREFG